jgi:hypothetical protein
MLPNNFFLLLFPVHPKGRICQKIIELLVIELVIGKRVTEADVVTPAIVIDLLHEHI